MFEDIRENETKKITLVMNNYQKEKDDIEK